MMVSHRLPHARLAATLAAAAALLVCGCDQKPPSSQPAGVREPPITPPAVLPTYEFAASCDRTAFPEISAFVTQFVETCLAGDYVGYRRLVSRYDNPESRERFQAIYHGLRSITILQIEKLPQIEGLPEGCFRVVTEANFEPAAKVALRHRSRKVAILVFPEDGGLRLRPAPAALQPQEDDLIQSTSAPTTTTSAPSYPWERDGDH